MATITVRNIPDEIHRALRQRAATHGRSTEAEVRDILANAALPQEPPKVGTELRKFWAEHDFPELDIPSRDPNSGQFNQDASAVKKAAESGPVIITDRGRPAHVLLTYEDYAKLAGTGPRIADLLALPGVEDIPFDPAPARDLPRPAGLD